MDRGRSGESSAKTTWAEAGRRALVSGTTASVASTAALLARGEAETQRPLAPINAISHWYWGDRAARRNAFSLRHTAMGYVTHHAASIFWATFYERLLARVGRRRSFERDLASATAIAALACFVDYRMTPRRLTPGYELRLGRGSLLVVYGCFALGLALGGRIGRASRDG